MRREEVREDPGNLFSPPRVNFDALEELPEGRSPSRTPSTKNRRVSSNHSGSVRNRRISGSPIKISDQLPPQRRQSFRVPDSKFLQRQSSIDMNRRLAITHERSPCFDKAPGSYTPLISPDKPASTFSPEKTASKSRFSPGKPVGNFSPNKPVEKFGPDKPFGKFSQDKTTGKFSPDKPTGKFTPDKPIERFSPDKAAGASGSEPRLREKSTPDSSPFGKRPLERHVDVSTLLPPIDKHTSDRNLDQVLTTPLDDTSGPSKMTGAGRERRHTICTPGTSEKKTSQSPRDSVWTKNRHYLDEIVNLNCSGEPYQVKRKLLVKYPNTLLGSPDLEHYYHPQLRAYFFDRNRQFFEHIMQFYLCGRLNIASNFDWMVAKAELTYFRISDEEVLEEWELSSEGSSRTTPVSLQAPSPNASPLRLKYEGFRQQLHIFLNEPKTSILALTYCLLDVVLVCLAMLLMMLETDSKLMPGATIEGTQDYKLIHTSDKIFMTFFSIDIFLRVLSWPTHKNCSYLREPMNVVDIVAVLPYYVQHIINLTTMPEEIDVVAILRATRLLRMVRIFRFVRHSDELFQIIRFVYETRNQLGIIYVFSHMIILLFGAAMFYAEGRPHFESILSSCWWSLVTLSTLGYGDKVPRTFIGCVVGSAAVMVGMVILSLPMTIVVSKFAEWYENEKKTERANRRQFKTVSPATN